MDHLVLINLDEVNHLAGMWVLSIEDAKRIFTHRPGFRKYQATQAKVKREASIA